MWFLVDFFHSKICSHFLETDVVHGNLVLPWPEEFVVRSNCLVQMGESVATKAGTAEKPRKPFSGCQKKAPPRKMEIKWTRGLHIYNHLYMYIYNICLHIYIIYVYASVCTLSIIKHVTWKNLLDFVQRFFQSPSLCQKITVIYIWSQDYLFGIMTNHRQRMG